MAKNHIGKTFYVALAVPATNNNTGFEALTFVKVNGYVSGPQFGFSHSNVDVDALSLGTTVGLKAMGSGMDSQVAFSTVASDAGQGHMKDLSDGARGLCSLKIVDSGGDVAPTTGMLVQYAQGYLHSFQINPVSGSTYEGFTAQFRQNAPHVNATQPA